MNLILDEAFLPAAYLGSAVRLVPAKTSPVIGSTSSKSAAEALTPITR
jgi:hypothetical protein